MTKLDPAAELRHVEALEAYGETVRRMGARHLDGLVAYAAEAEPKIVQHSLMLAWLLDPIRSGDIATQVWPALIAELNKRVADGRSGHDAQKAALELWHPRLLERVEVDPKSYGAEVANLDVFARVDDGNGYEFGLVIENKVRESTSEQERQLDRYHEWAPCNST